MDNKARIIDALKNQKVSELFQILEKCSIDPPFLKMILEEITLPVLDEINAMTIEEGQVFKEHRLSEMLMMLYIGIQEKLLKNTLTQKSEDILLLCPEGERHDLILRWLELILIQEGFNVYYSGPDIPNSQVPLILNAIKPTCVIMSITNFYNLFKAKETYQMIEATSPEARIFIGGKAIEHNPDYFKKEITVMSIADLLQKMGVAQ